MKRKWFGIALVMSMLLTLTACGNDNKETTAAPAGSGETASSGSTEESTEAPVAELPEYNAADYVSLDNYVGVEVEVKDSVVTGEEFEAALADLLKESATVEEITDRETQTGDTICVSYSGAIDGEKFEGGTTSEPQFITLGNGGFIDGFEEGMIGKPCGEEFVVDARFPDEYPNNPALEGKTAQFTTTIHYIKGETILPELTDEFVKGLENYTVGTVEEFRDVFMQELSERKAAYMENQAKNSLWAALLENAEFNGFPEGYVDAYTQDMIMSYTAQASAYGFSLEDFIQGMYGMDMEMFQATVKESAEMQVKTEILYQYIAEKENITVSEEDYLAMVQEYMAYYNFDDMTKFVNTFGVENVEKQGHADALFQNVSQFCYDHAVKVPAAQIETGAADEVTE